MMAFAVNFPLPDATRKTQELCLILAIIICSANVRPVSSFGMSPNQNPLHSAILGLAPFDRLSKQSGQICEQPVA